jgi:bifunctional isochorismate lyase / aryl carrier protein
VVTLLQMPVADLGADDHLLHAGSDSISLMSLIER